MGTVQCGEEKSTPSDESEAVLGLLACDQGRRLGVNKSTVRCGCCIPSVTSKVIVVNTRKKTNREELKMHRDLLDYVDLSLVTSFILLEFAI